MAKAYEIGEYRKKLKSHDWTFEYSEDQSVWRRGRQERDALQQLQKRLDPDCTIWNSIAPSDFQRGGK